jgi:phosphate/sulfate permease
MGTKLRRKNDQYSFFSQIILPLLVFAVIAAAVAFLLSLATSHVWERIKVKTKELKVTNHNLVTLFARMVVIS